MVTKQQQLEWLAKEFCIWPAIDGAPIRMSSVTIGEVNDGLGVAHYIRMDEWQHEREQMFRKPNVDNSWHERGEFPPAGTECEVYYNGEWIAMMIIGVDSRGYCVVEVPNLVVDAPHYDGMMAANKFRPIRTERGKAIDAACKAIGEVIGGRLIIERLYDAGLLK